MSNLQIKVMVFDNHCFSKPIQIDNTWIAKLNMVDVADTDTICLRKLCNDTCILKIPAQRNTSKIAYIYDMTKEQHFLIDEVAFNELYAMLGVQK